MLKALQDLVSRLAGNPELPAQQGHALPVFEPNHKAHPFVHNRTFLPWHPSSAPPRVEKCNPCLRYALLPMSQAGHLTIDFWSSVYTTVDDFVTLGFRGQTGEISWIKAALSLFSASIADDSR